MRRRVMMGKESGLNSLTIDVARRTLFSAFANHGVDTDVEELVLVGKATPSNTATYSLNQDSLSIGSYFPNLRRMLVLIDSVEYMTSSEIVLGHYAFSSLPATVEYIQIGKIGVPFRSGGYFRNDMPIPPGTSKYNIGSAVGLTLVSYLKTYNNLGGFTLGALAPNTTVHCMNWETGEEMFS